MHKDARMCDESVTQIGSDATKSLMDQGSRTGTRDPRVVPAVCAAICDCISMRNHSRILLELVLLQTSKSPCMPRTHTFTLENGIFHGVYRQIVTLRDNNFKEGGFIQSRGCCNKTRMKGW